MSVELFTLLISASVGVSVLASNPRRTINQAFAAASLFVASWLWLLWKITSTHPENPVPWIKAISAIGAFFPWLLWWLAHCIIYPECKWSELLTKGKYVLASGCVLAAIAGSNWFIPSESTRDTRLWGQGALVYNAGLLVFYLLLVGLGIREARRQRGIQLVEIRIFVFGGTISCLAGLAMTMLAPMFGLHDLRKLAPLAVLFFYGLTVWGITSRRVFDARLLFFSVTRRVLVLVITSALLSLWLDLAGPMLPPGVAMVLGFAAGVALVVFVDQRTKDSLIFSRARYAERVRATLLGSGRDQSEPEALSARYIQILSSWGRTAVVDIRPANVMAAQWDLELTSTGMQLLLEERWATPESLTRRRMTPAVEELDRLLAAHKLGAVVVSPPTAGTSPMVIALGRREDGMPFLWPDIENLLEWSDLMEVSLSRAQLTKRARETEQIATAGLLGASLAHEIRNPLVALKTFAELLPERHADPEFRDSFSQLLRKEIGRIVGLTDQLLKLSTPAKPVLRPLQLNDIARECVHLVQAKYDEGHTRLILELDDTVPVVQADLGSIHQVVLNLLMNAMQAVAERPDGREVRVRTSRLPASVALEVADNGPGVPLAQRARLFQPFSSGKINGFGLGLAVSGNIMRLHQGTIALVDTSSPGATFRITLPCPPS